MPARHNSSVYPWFEPWKPIQDTSPSSGQGLSDWFSWLETSVDRGLALSCKPHTIYLALISVVTNLQNENKLHNQVNQYKKY